MSALTHTRRQIEAAWRAFVLDGTSSAPVRPEILRSWQPVRGAWHVDPALRTCPAHALALEAGDADGTRRPPFNVNAAMQLLYARPAWNSVYALPRNDEALPVGAARLERGTALSEDLYALHDLSVKGSP